MSLNTKLDEFCRKLPKVELHAHLNGSISEATLSKLIERKLKDFPDGVELAVAQRTINKGQRRTLDECFAMFRIIHPLTDTAETIYMVTCDVIRDFAEDNVKYLELRSTPRHVPATGMTKETYVRAILKAIEDCKESMDIIVKFMLAIDMRNTLEGADETVELANKLKDCSNGVVVGVDFSGDPKAGDARSFIPVFQKAQSYGLKLALHLAEVPERNEETLEVLKLIPGRVGHGTFLLPEDGGNQELVDVMVQNKIPLELCLTSNIKGQTVAAYDNHHFKKWYDIGHPISVCTDDKGVFSTTLSEEYSILAQTFELSQEKLWDISYKSIDLIFADEKTKAYLRGVWEKERENVFKLS
ncbi:adenosine deaminase-like protein [Lingula anatina]|uniref:Adenosine deaminase-like protein n=1 Tax=Lingula anatina TaxID=7574 RepID=A0A1S3J9H1_LINAN|nr:adenosine deaminase-like protein [Lingula anatina]|eukprot:XP_013406866.1 adenosine deaminase-like protein [Lingula anatina]